MQHWTPEIVAVKLHVLFTEADYRDFLGTANLSAFGVLPNKCENGV